jgi:hypothetical protein
MKKINIFVLAATLMMAVGVIVAYPTSAKNSMKQASQSAKPATTLQAVHHVMGTVSSLTANELVLDRRWKGKEEKTRFTLDSGTKKEGNLKQGERAIVTYNLEKGQRIATEVKVPEAKPMAGAKKS